MRALPGLTLLCVLCQVMLHSVATANSCEPLANTTSNFCKSLGYTMTVLPNRFDHRTQQEASNQLNDYMPLLKISCANDTTIFLCSVYLPMCNSMSGKGIPPCRSVCQNVYNGCVGILKNFGYMWPPLLNCSSFPENGGTEVCVTQDSPKDTGSANTTPVSTKTLRTNSKKCQKGKRKARCCGYGKLLWKKTKGCSLLVQYPPRRLKISKIEKKCKPSGAKNCLETCCQYAQRKDASRKKTTSERKGNKGVKKAQNKGVKKAENKGVKKAENKRKSRKGLKRKNSRKVNKGKGRNGRRNRKRGQ